MLLAVDAGNTNTVFGLVDLSVPTSEWDRAVLAQWRLATDPHRTSDELGILVGGLLGSGVAGKPAEIEAMVVSSTVPDATTRIVALARDWLRVPYLVVTPAVNTGMPLNVDTPAEVGPDRIANAVAVLARHGGPAVVVDFGTATTVDAVSASGDYLGGAIMPGIEISMDALYQRAAMLRRVELAEPRSAIGRTTTEGISSGALYGFAAQADGLCRRFLDELGPAPVVATGGLSGLIASYCALVSSQEPLLTLHGLRIIHERNQPPSR